MMRRPAKISIERRIELLHQEAHAARHALHEARIRAQHLEYLSPPQAAIVSAELRRAQLDCAWVEHELEIYGALDGR